MAALSMQPDVEIDASIRSRLRVLALHLDGVRVDQSEQAYAELAALARALAHEHAGRTSGAVELAAESRRLYRQFGLDPTRTRPSSEAILRRALRGLELYRISNVVDVGNLISLRWQLSLGLYDADRIVGPRALVRLGREGEGYAGIRKDRVHVAGRLCVADALGAFGSPTSDSERSSVSAATTRLLVLLFAPADGDAARLRAAGADIVQALATHAGARLCERGELF
jgi:DNA/RNA-binding domain of Phe-tRNA-synthetase-like protein